jgi:uncharacterized protein YkvS
LEDQANENAEEGTNVTEFDIVKMDMDFMENYTNLGIESKNNTLKVVNYTKYMKPITTKHSILK